MQEKPRPAPNSDAIRDFPLRLWIKRNGDNNQQAWRAGAEILGCKVPYCVEELDAATVELLTRPGVKDALSGRSPSAAARWWVFRRGGSDAGFRNRPLSLHAVDDLRNADEQLYEGSLSGGSRRRIRLFTQSVRLLHNSVNRNRFEDKIMKQFKTLPPPLRL